MAAVTTTKTEDDPRHEERLAEQKKKNDARLADEQKKTAERVAQAYHQDPPTPTQAELDDAVGGKDRDKKPEEEQAKKSAEERQKAAEMVPTPTQEEADKMKLAALHSEGKDAKDSKEGKDAKDSRAEIDKRVAKAYEHEDPTPSQAENDAAKLAAMPGEALDPLPPQAPPYGPQGDRPEIEPQARRKQSEAGPPRSNYETRSMEPAPRPVPKPAE